MGTIDLSSGLGGTPDVGGTWNDDDGTGATISVINLDVSCLGVGSYNFTYTTSSAGCPDATATVNVAVESCIGIPSMVVFPLFSLYPNPSEGNFTIEFVNTAKDARIEVYSATGELITEYVGEAKVEVDLTGNPNGLYYINVITGDDVITTKVSIAR